MKDKIAYNKGWNDAVRSMAVAESNGSLSAWFTKINKAFKAVKRTCYHRGVFDAIQAHQETLAEKLAKEIAV